MKAFVVFITAFIICVAISYGVIFLFTGNIRSWDWSGNAQMGFGLLIFISLVFAGAATDKDPE